MNIKVLFFASILIIQTAFCFSQSKILMDKDGDIYTIPCKVNGLSLKFIFDTGASNVSISETEALFMIKNGYLDIEDIGEKTYYSLANGETIKGTKIKLKEIEIGGIALNNIEASILHNLRAPLLLGQSAISKLGKYSIENDYLILHMGNEHEEKELDYSNIELNTTNLNSILFNFFGEEYESDTHLKSNISEIDSLNIEAKKNNAEASFILGYRYSLLYYTFRDLAIDIEKTNVVEGGNILRDRFYDEFIFLCKKAANSDQIVEKIGAIGPNYLLGMVYRRNERKLFSNNLELAIYYYKQAFEKENCEICVKVLKDVYKEKGDKKKRIYLGVKSRKFRFHIRNGGLLL